jgi:hypothetical protein
MKTLLILFVFFLSFNLNAFEVKGFKEGMSYEEVIAKANSKSWYLEGFSATYYDIKNQEGKSELLLYLCKSNKKVWQLSHLGHAEKFHIYPKLIENFEKKGFYIYYTDVNSYISDGIEHNNISILMRGDSVDYQVEVMLYSTDKYGVSNYQIAYSYDERNYCNN